MIAYRGGPAAKNVTTMELRSDREIVISRAFNGPARIVFDAWTNPALVKRWWAPASRGVTVVGCDAAVRAGGTYRYVLRLSTGHEVAFSGTYAEVTPPSRLVYTQIFEPAASGANPGAEQLVITVTFDERDGKTHVVLHSLCPSKEVRDQILATGMEQGMRETWDQLDELVASLG
ncbi:MAG: SRPBCC family protein [Gemmatimonadetes bacterium]|nr:SRPBCC family protein [Gemmatimonadota bacterium]